MIHHVQFGTRFRQPAQLNVQFLCEPAAGFGGMRCVAIQEKNNAPTAPMTSDLMQHDLKLLFMGNRSGDIQFVNHQHWR